MSEEATVDETGQGGHCETSHESSAIDLPPHIDTSDQPLPGPADLDAAPARQDPEGNRWENALTDVVTHREP